MPPHYRQASWSATWSALALLAGQQCWALALSNTRLFTPSAPARRNASIGGAPLLWFEDAYASAVAANCSSSSSSPNIIEPGDLYADDAAAAGLILGHVDGGSPASAGTAPARSRQQLLGDALSACAELQMADDGSPAPGSTPAGVLRAMVYLPPAQMQLVRVQSTGLRSYFDASSSSGTAASAFSAKLAGSVDSSSSGAALQLPTGAAFSMELQLLNGAGLPVTSVCV